MKLTVFLSLVLCLSAAAQPNPINRRAMAIAGLAAHNPTPCIASVTDPSQIPGLAFRWISSDLTLNANVSDWIDRVQSNHLVQSSVGNQPVNQATGVRFNESKYLVSTNWTMTTAKDSLFMIWSIDNANTHDLCILGRNVGGTDRLNVVDGATDNTISWTIVSGSAAGFSSRNFGSMDVEYFMGTATNGWYTNGVFNSGTTGTGPTTQTILKVGVDGGLVGYYLHGNIREIAYYTNVTFTADQVCSLHYYATNTYGFTP